ncbi:putative ankyrin repeat protein RF_0381 [Cloeon dipterum]|uniref:putative ankyrin repeat protein RF_0381 n=1 Tax=Cloeon dipterum TaxID=197152 RepID=UPI003220290F
MCSPLKKLRLFKTHKLLTGDASALMEAALFGDVEACKKLLKESADLNEKTKSYRCSVMHFAAVNRKYGKEVVKYFASRGLNMEELDLERESPIDYALREELFEVAKELIKLQFSRNNLLHYCVYKNKLVSAKEVHEHDRELIKEPGPDGTNVLHVAASYADQSLCEWLIDEAGVDVYSLSETAKSTALHYVCFNHAYAEDLVPFFIYKGLHVNYANDDGLTPIQCALVTQNLEAVESLVDFNANLRVEYMGQNLMHFCIANNCLLSAKLLHKIDPELFNEDDAIGRNVFHKAVMTADERMCVWLHEERVCTTRPWRGYNSLALATFNEKHGGRVVQFCISNINSDLNQFGNVPIFSALATGNIDAADELCKYGADLRGTLNGDSLLVSCLKANKLKSVQFLHKMDKSLFKEPSAALVAAMNGDLTTFKWLVEQANVNPRVLCKTAGGSVLHFAAMNEAHGKFIAEYVISNFKLDVNKKCKNGFTPLVAALQNNNFETAEELCKYESALKVKVGNENILVICVRSNLLKAAQFVLRKDKNLIEVELDDGKTILQYAAYFTDLDFCRWLIEENVDPMELSKIDKSSALHLATLNLNHGTEIINFFVSTLNMDKNLKSLLGTTPIILAVQARNIGAVKKLCELGANLTVHYNGENLVHRCVILDDLDVAKLLHRFNPQNGLLEV